MNTNMYRNPILQRNISILKELGYNFVDPDSGRLACGDIGEGKLASPEKIVDAVVDLFNEDKKDLLGKKIMITAGPTVESIAKMAANRGADVTLVSGPTNIEPPSNIKKLIKVQSAKDMYDAIIDNFDENQVIIKSAAVADYKPKNYSDKKIKKSNDDLIIELDRNKDIAYELGKIKKNKILVGFAAETNDLIENAKGKISKKNLDFIVANDLTESGAGFGTDTNIVKIIDKDGNIAKYPQMKKDEVADVILDKVKSLLEK